MQSFILDVLEDVKTNNNKLDSICFIVPSKRAANFIKRNLYKVYKPPIFSPEIYSIEEFISKLSNLKLVSHTELIFYLYDAYKTHNSSSETESFDSFFNWAQIVLQDFNEIDRYLIDEEELFNYLKAIHTLNHWSLEANAKTDLIKDYLSFWNSLKDYYKTFQKILKNQGKAYQGLIYKEAFNNLIENIANNSNIKYIFLGFNALNTAEMSIMQSLLKDNLAEIYWDIDQYFMDNNYHSTGYFIKHYQSTWSYYTSNEFKWVSDNYTSSKNIKVTGVSGTVTQTKYVGQILDTISRHNPNFESVALVLGDESLLLPTLNSLPKSVSSVNVTMGLPLKDIPLSTFFNRLFSIQKKDASKFYYEDVLALISHPFIQNSISKAAVIDLNRLKKYIKLHNTIYLSLDAISNVTQNQSKLITLLFANWENNPSIAIKVITSLIGHIHSHLKNNKSFYKLELEYLHKFHLLFNQIKNLNSNYNHIDNITVLHNVFKELVNSESLDFQGEPLSGLQIMGMLESRVLDFETVIITSVNEGILPAGKTQNSFIPFDVKLQYQLPTYKEKDAVYTYHFYRLLQRAKNIYIVYNTEVDALKGGEKSRFITQLELEGIHNIEHVVVSSEIPKQTKTALEIKKDSAILEDLKQVAQRGFSPSSLTNYIRNPIDFYYDKILGVREMNDVEETISANTLGTVIHKTLEDLYKPFEGKFLKVEDLNKMTTQIDTAVQGHFKTLLKQGNFKEGKNLIIFEIAKRYISNFIQQEQEDVQQSNTLKIVATELKVETQLTIPELNFPISLKGEIDRVDEYNSVTRIIDYKSGKVLQSHLEIIDWDTITQDYDAYSKAFQVLMYTYILYKNQKIQLPVEAGIVSFKNLKSGVLRFAKKESSRGKKDYHITEEVLHNFEAELKKLILEICNPDSSFIEKIPSNGSN